MMNYTNYMDKQKLLVAVSGGIDSVVLLDVLVKLNTYDMTVAHFDHGIRRDSAADARFVAGLAKQYGLPFVSRREELGAQASEERARVARYAFLFREANARQALIATAHHMDDVIESIAINGVRGTGWRGLAVLERKGIVRPLLRKTKADIRQYALENRLEWVEDVTNAHDAYLRNRLRRLIARRLLIATKLQLLQLRDQQLELRNQIDAECRMLLSPALPYSRYFFSQLDQASALELLRAIMMRHAKESATRPQLMRAWLAIKTAKPGTRHDVAGEWQLVFTARNFIVEKR